MRFTRSLSVLAAVALVAGACADATSPAAPPAATARVHGPHPDASSCPGYKIVLHVYGPTHILVGESEEYQVGITDEYGCALPMAEEKPRWQSDDESVLSTTYHPLTGRVTVRGEKAGEAELFVDWEGFGQSIVVSVGDPAGLARLELTPNPATTAIGTNAHFSARGYDAAGHAYGTGNLVWSVDDATVATMDQAAAAATGVGLGTTTVRATSGSVVGTAPLTVTPWVGATGPSSVYEGPFTVSATVNPSGTWHYTWYEDTCTTGEPCTGWHQVAAGTNVASVTRTMSRYDIDRSLKVEIRAAAGGAVQNTDIAAVAGGGEMQPGGGSCGGQFNC